MIFFGSRSKTVPGQQIQGVECPSCGKDEHVTFGVLRYFHLYWIPTFVTSKIVGMECTHCKKTFTDKELPKDLAQHIKSTVFTKKNTLPMFSGVIIIALLVMFGAFAVQQTNQKEATYIAQPTTGDIYIVNFTKIFDNADPKYKYGAMRINNLSSTQVEFLVSKIAYNKAKGVSKDIREGKTSSDTYYDSEAFVVDVSKLKEMKQSGAIYSIKRL